MGTTVQGPAAAPQNAEALERLQWAEPAQGLGAKVDLASLLVALQLMATDQARDKAAELTRWADDTPASMQVIKSGAMSITRSWTKYIAGVGGFTGAAATIGGTIAALFKDFRTTVGAPITVALIAGGSLILAASAIAIALFVKGDLEARGVATAARHTGRAQVAAAFLNASAMLPASGAGGATTAVAETVNGGSSLAALEGNGARTGAAFVGINVDEFVRAVFDALVRIVGGPPPADD